jgi:hypothetical protein
MSSLGPQFDPLTFEEAVTFARLFLLGAGVNVARTLGIPPPSVREEKTLKGVRLILVWHDGEETNECTIQCIDDQIELSKS